MEILSHVGHLGAHIAHWNINRYDKESLYFWQVPRHKRIKKYFTLKEMTPASHLAFPLQKLDNQVFLLTSQHAVSQGCSLAALTSLLTSSSLAWVHPVTFVCVDDVVRPEEGVIDLDWHKQPVPCLACHTASLGHCSMPECQMRRDGEDTGWWPAGDDASYSLGQSCKITGQKR